MQRFHKIALLFCSILVSLFIATSVYATDYDYAVMNETNETLGTVSVNLVDGSSIGAQIDTYSGAVFSLTQDIISITINGQIVLMDMPSSIRLPSGTTVEIIVKKPNTKVTY